MGADNDIGGGGSGRLRCWPRMGPFFARCGRTVWDVFSLCFFRAFSLLKKCLFRSMQSCLYLYVVLLIGPPPSVQQVCICAGARMVSMSWGYRMLVWGVRMRGK